jgi:hypothetical protein
VVARVVVVRRGAVLLVGSVVVVEDRRVLEREQRLAVTSWVSAEM